MIGIAPAGSHVAQTIAIIVPVYNRAGLVTRAIDSVLSQAGERAQVIVIDDGSTDATPEVLARYEADPLVDLVRHRSNRGVAAAKNTGLDHVPRGTALVGILDSDDVLLPGALAALAAVAAGPDGERWSQVFGWCRDAETADLTGSMVHREGPITYDDALAGRFFGEFWQLARMDLIGERRFEPRARGGESAVWWPLLRERPAWLIPDVVRAYDRSGDDRVSRLDYRRPAAEGTMWVYRAGLRAYGADLRRDHPGHYATQATELSKWAALAGQGKIARAAARAAWRARPSRQTTLALAMALTPPAVLRFAATRRAANRGKAPKTPAPG
jgi:glycosyltransferase involved in cell wall biosynthesis